MPFAPSYVRQRRISLIGAEAFGTMQAFRTYLGVAQLVARYLGVVEAASSSLVTQTK